MKIKPKAFEGLPDSKENGEKINCHMRISKFLLLVAVYTYKQKKTHVINFFTLYATLFLPIATLFCLPLSLFISFCLYQHISLQTHTLCSDLLATDLFPSLAHTSYGLNLNLMSFHDWLNYIRCLRPPLIYLSVGSNFPLVERKKKVHTHRNLYKTVFCCACLPAWLFYIN